MRQPMVGQEPLLQKLLVLLENLRMPEELVPQIVSSISAERPDTVRERVTIESRLRKLTVLFLETEVMTREEYPCRKDRYQRQFELLGPVVTTSDTAIELARYLRDFRAWFANANEFELNLMLQHVLSTMVAEGQKVNAIGLVTQAHRLLEAYSSHTTRLPAWDKPSDSH